MTISVYGINLLNSLDTKLTNIKTVRSFGHRYKKATISEYMYNFSV